MIFIVIAMLAFTVAYWTLPRVKRARYTAAYAAVMLANLIMIAIARSFGQ